MLSILRSRSGQILGVLAVFGLFAALGFKLGRYGRRPSTHAVRTTEAALRSTQSSLADSTAPLNRFSQAAKRVLASAPTPVQWVGDGEQGADLWMVAALSSRPEVTTLEESLYWEKKALERAANEPERSLKELRKAWSRLTADEYTAERAAILMLAGQIPGGQEEFRQEAQEELRRPVEPAPADATEDQSLSTRPEEAAPVAAHAFLLRSDVGDEQAISATIEALSLQPSGFVRGAILTQFRALRNEAWDLLGERLQRLGTSDLRKMWEKVNQ